MWISFQKWTGFIGVMLSFCAVGLLKGLLGLSGIMLGALLVGLPVLSAMVILGLELVRTRHRSLCADNPKEREIESLVKKIAQKANVSTPIIEFQFASPNHVELEISSIGFPLKNTLLISEHLLTVYQNGFTQDSFEALIAHEIGHLKHYDTVTVFTLNSIRLSLCCLCLFALAAIVLTPMTAGLLLSLFSLCGLTVGAELFFAQFSRAIELQADAAAVTFTYNAKGSVRFIYDMYLQFLFWGELVIENQWAGFAHYPIPNKMGSEHLKALHATLSDDNYRSTFYDLTQLVQMNNSTLTWHEEIRQRKDNCLSWLNTHPKLAQREQNIKACVQSLSLK